MLRTKVASALEWLIKKKLSTVDCWCSVMDLHATSPSISLFISEQWLTLILLLANLANTKIMRKTLKMIETLANGYSSESTHRELFNEYHHDRV